LNELCGHNEVSDKLPLVHGLALDVRAELHGHPDLVAEEEFMKTRYFTLLIGMSLFATLAMPVWTAAQDNPSQDHKPRHKKYRLIDVGTFGGPASNVADLQRIINNGGVLAGGADTVIPDPYFPNCFDPECFVQHAFQWRNGVLADIGALPGVNSSSGFEINGRGWIVGVSQNGLIDPLSGTPEDRPVLWKDGRIIDLGTLGGNQGQANSINDTGQVAGVAFNDVPDPFTGTTQFRGFLWQRGIMYDLGTLGGPDAFGQYINNHGQVAGFSFTNSTANATTGLPTTDPFLWENGRMRDLGTLGGTNGQVNCLNNRGQVVGTSNLAGDIFTHGFLWDRGVLKDVGTFGGDNSTAMWIDEAGDVVGAGDFPGDQTHDAFLLKNGVKTDLGNLGGTSTAHAINEKGQIVGASRALDGNPHAFLWENGGPMVDLNALIPSNSSLQLQFANYISDPGEIAGVGVPAGCNSVNDGCGHAFVLIADGDCDDDCEGRIAQSQSSIAASQNQAALAQNPEVMKQGSETLLSPIERFRSMMRQRYHLPGQPAALRD
jgi:probable HAF family extracellular repeat protein